MSFPFDLKLTSDTFFLICLFFVFFLLSVFLISGILALRKFPSLNNVNVFFQERWASGNSYDTFIHKYGGAINALDIIITEKELWIKPFLLVAGFSSVYGLIRKIQITDIREVSSKNELIVIHFANESGSMSEFHLKLKGKQQFLKVITDKMSETIVNQ
ncbi:MAG: hypothetical protein AAFQ94_23695 [Bacteroidota bacterium]